MAIENYCPKRINQLLIMSFPRILEGTDVACPIPGCPGTATTRPTMRRHFTHRHRDWTLHIVEDGPPPAPCELCGTFITANALVRGHRNSGVCRAAAKRKRQREALQNAKRARTERFNACGTELEQVQTFKYLGRPLSSTDNDWPAVYLNLNKARKRWARVRTILARDNATPKVSAMFYKAIVQSVLLYGVETWVFTDSILQTLRGFHHRVARSLTGLKPRLQNGEWVYPPIEDALQAAGMHPMERYIVRRRRTIMERLPRSPHYSFVQNATRLSGTPTGTRYWWEQPGNSVM